MITKRIAIQRDITLTVSVNCEPSDLELSNRAFISDLFHLLAVKYEGFTQDKRSTIQLVSSAS